jgi:hypothetical protein
MEYDLTTPLVVGDRCYVVEDPYKGAIAKIVSLPDKPDGRYGVSRNGFTGLQLPRKWMHLLSRDRKLESEVQEDEESNG